MSVARVSAALVSLSTLACSSLQPVHQPAEFIAANHPMVMYVTYTDNSTIAVSMPRVRGDTLRGMEQGVGEAVTVPLNQIQSLQAVQKDKKETTMLIAGLGVTLALGTYALIQTTGGKNGLCVFVERGVDVVRPGAC